jgi:hypothetical protein
MSSVEGIDAVAEGIDAVAEGMNALAGRDASPECPVG